MSNFSSMGIKILAIECSAAVAIVFAQISDSNIALIIGLLTLIVTRVFDIVDRRQQARQLSNKTADVAEDLRIKTARQIDSIKTAVGENTQLTREGVIAAKDAYKEANTVNQKLENIGVTMADGNPLSER